MGGIKNMTKTYIFDLDGTLALIDHRRHLVEKPKPEWREFFKACIKDEPNFPVIDTLITLYDAGYNIIIASGRSDEVKSETLNWLNTYVLPNIEHRERIAIVMRNEGDFRSDVILKKEWLDTGLLGPKYNIKAVFDDRDSVVEMWRENGLACFQVAKGSF
jgi:hypothetical protein